MHEQLCILPRGCLSAHVYRILHGPQEMEQCPSAEEWTAGMWCLHTMDCYSDARNNEMYRKMDGMKMYFIVSEVS